MMFYDAFNVGETNYTHLDDETWSERGRWRQSMAVLIMSDDNHSQIYL